MAELGLGVPTPRKYWVALGLVVGLVVGLAVGYYLNAATLQYAYKLLESAQQPPPDAYVVALSPKGAAFFLTAMGTPITTAQWSGGAARVAGAYRDMYIAYDVDRGRILQIAQDLEVKNVVYIDGLVGVYLDEKGGYVYALSRDKLYKISADTLDVVKSVEVPNGVYIAGINEPSTEVYVLTESSLVKFDGDLNRLGEVAVSGRSLFVGVLYFFVGGDGFVKSFDKSGRQIAEAKLAGGASQLLACRGILLASTDGGVYALSIPDLRIIKKIDARGILYADPTCSMVYAVEDSKATVILIPSLNTHVVNLPEPLDGLIFRTGAGAALGGGAMRKVALACGG